MIKIAGGCVNNSPHSVQGAGTKRSEHYSQCCKGAGHREPSDSMTYLTVIHYLPGTRM